MDRKSLKKFFEKSGIVCYLSLEELMIKAIEKWGKKIKNVQTSFFPDYIDFQIKIFKQKELKHLHSVEIVHFIEKNNLFFPNFWGLEVLENLDKVRDFLPAETWILGYDKKENLPKDNTGTLVPFLKKNQDRTYSYGFLPWKMSLDHDEVFVAIGFNKKNLKAVERLKNDQLKMHKAS